MGRKDLKRLRQITVILLENELGFLVDKIKLKKHLPLSHKISSIGSDKFKKNDLGPKRILKVFEEVGGAFLKLGQLLSLRPDLIPEEYSEALKELRDHIPSFSGEEAKQIVEEQLGKPLNQIFKKFDMEPVASASVSQVHHAILKNGKEVAVKVQRPDVSDKFNQDIALMRTIGKLIERKYKTKFFNANEIVGEFERYTHQELDFLNEAKNIQHFYDVFKDNKFIVVPQVYWDYTTSKVIVMEFILGKPLTDTLKSGIKLETKKKLLDNIFKNIFQQIFFDGYFHADPHPGNFLYLQGGKVAMLDFGIVGRLDDKLKERVGLLYMGVVEGNLDRMVNALISLGFAKSGQNYDQLKQDLYVEMRAYHGTSLKMLKASEVLNKLILVARKNNLALPSNVVLFIKSLITLEGLGRELNPDFNLVTKSKPFIEKLKREKFAPEFIKKKIERKVNEFKDVLVDIPEGAKNVKMVLNRMETDSAALGKYVKVMTVEMDKSSNRVSLGFIIGALIIASASLLSNEHFIMFGMSGYSFIGFSLALILIMFLAVSVMREKTYDQII